MDSIDLQLQDVIGDLEAGLLRAVDSPAITVDDRERAARLRSTLGYMRVAVVRITPTPKDPAIPPELEERLAALRRRTRTILEQWDTGDELHRIDDTMDDTIRIMSVVGKWPPAT